jgi:hypothetical protein
MTNYAMQIKAFRRETRLQVFSDACEDKPEKDDGRFSLLVTKHDMDWATATLEDVENFRIDVCRELSLYTFSLNLSVVAQGCVEVTWQVPHSLVAYIQASIKPSSPSMMKHHVSTLTIDGFIAYHSTTAMQGEHKVIRLELQAIHVHFSYMLDEIAPDQLLPHLVKRKLPSRDKANEVMEMSSRIEKVSAIIRETRANAVVGTLPTFCAALVSAELPHIAKKLTDKFKFLLKGLKGEVKEDVMISGEVSAPPPPPPPDCCLITAQVEGSTLTHTQYNSVASLMSSLLCLPTRALVYVGHTLNPLTLHWHCTAAERGDSDPNYSIGLLSEMAQEGIGMINVGTAQEIVIPQRNEMKLFESAWDGDVECVRSVLEMGVPVNVARPDGRTPLIVASQKGHVQVAAELLQHGARVDMQNKDGGSPLIAASLNGHVQVVAELLQHGARVDMQNKDGGSPLIAASLNGHVQVVAELLQHGARVDLQDKDGDSPLIVASQNGHVQVVAELLQHGARVDLQDKDGDSPLIVASQKGHVQVAAELLQHGGELTCRIRMEGVL